MSRNDQSLNRYTFHNLTLTFRGLGVPFLSDKTQAIIAAMDAETALATNRAAWKQFNESARILNRHHNFSVAGNIPIYDSACQHNLVAKEIARFTYKRLKALGVK